MLNPGEANGLEKDKWSEYGSKLNKNVAMMDKVDRVERVWSYKLIFKLDATEGAYRYTGVV